MAIAPIPAIQVETGNAAKIPVIILIIINGISKLFKVPQVA